MEGSLPTPTGKISLMWDVLEGICLIWAPPAIYIQIGIPTAHPIKGGTLLRVHAGQDVIWEKGQLLDEEFSSYKV
jgi:hypothetical protein